jgi:methionine synthase II (cobalamin-independent)
LPALDPPFRAEIIGSFLRPPAIKQARADFRAGRLSAEALSDVEDEAIRGVVALQEEVGLAVATDGEFRRGTYSDSFTTSGITGVAVDHVAGGDWTYSDGKGGTRPGRVPVVHERIQWAGPRNARDFAFLKSLVKRAMPKITLPGPGYIHYRAGRANISRDVYPDLDGFWADLVAAYHAEIRSLHDAGCRYLQLDETSIAKLGDPKIQRALAARGDDWERLLVTYTDAINAVLGGVPADMRVGMHLCRGNQEGHWQAAGGYDPVAEHLFRRARVGFYFLEYDSPRAGSFAPLAALPAEKAVVLGLVSTKTAQLETAEHLKARIAEAAQVVPLERLCLSPQCGFASSEAGNPLDPGDQRAKLARVVEVSREVWG